MKNKLSHPIYGILSFLDERRIYYSIVRNRPDAIDVFATLVGMRIEISIFEDGHLEYSKFEGDERVFSDRDELLSLLDAASN
ncbi:hypothetical protein OE766_28900 [Pararhizobium sp. YC-54]|uniref:hypothetical protein n=1 Tax=Pararhizobium sp. YC-54 TaxID=2986920 RepID=UPI0021F797FC|nr:hypothetical protein [Pararhizobium sp. YC-54]MCW0002218.1 hypothetical protein [Pararhizobium sp. YC-54]